MYIITNLYKNRNTKKAISTICKMKGSFLKESSARSIELRMKSPLVNQQKKMKLTKQTLLLFIISLTIWNCSLRKKAISSADVVYKSETLIVTRLSENTFIHTSFLKTNDFGNVACNGLVVRDANETIVFDTPTNDQSAEELIKWINSELQCKINAIIPTHFHDDCLGGLEAFHLKEIPSHANVKTIELAKVNDEAVPQNSFSDSLVMSIGSEIVVVKFFGEGHTKDNVVGYFPSEGILFGGCLIKELDATKGYLGDANLDTWSSTVQKIKNQYHQVKKVVPGHGAAGDVKLLDYTINLFKVQ